MSAVSEPEDPAHGRQASRCHAARRPHPSSPLLHGPGDLLRLVSGVCDQNGSFPDPPRPGMRSWRSRTFGGALGARLNVTLVWAGGRLIVFPVSKSSIVRIWRRGCWPQVDL